MKKLLVAATALIALPVAAQAQSLQPGGFYIGAEGGINWLLNTSSTANVQVGGFAGSGNVNINTNLGWTAGGMIGYDFIGPRVELESRFITKHDKSDRSRRCRLAERDCQSGADHGQPVL